MNTFDKPKQMFSHLFRFFDFNKILFIEPKFSNIVDLTEYHNICYHFTDMKNIDSILRNGLRIKNNSYRTYPERIYLYKTNNLFSNNQLNPDILLTTSFTLSSFTSSKYFPNIPFTILLHLLSLIIFISYPSLNSIL